MRIVLISPLPPARDGIADYTARLAAAYRSAGHDVAAVTASPQPDAAFAPVLGSLTWSPVGLLRLARAVRRWRPDAVQVQHGIATYGPRLLPLWALVMVCRVAGVRLVLTHHEVTRDVDRLGLPARLYYRFVSNLAAVVHVHTDKARDVLVDVLHVPASRVLVMPHPVYDSPASDVSGDELRRRHDVADRTLLLLFGFVHVEKGLRELVEGLAVLVRRDPSVADRVRLVVAGDVRPRPAAFGRFEQADRDYLDDVRARVEAHGLGDVVALTGHVPDGEVSGWFEAADVAVLPYTHSEQSGVANLAIAAGVPVLASSTGGLGELFARDLPTFAALDPESVADGLARFLDAAPDAGVVARCYAELTDASSPARLAELLSQRLGVGVERTGAAA
ncbi:glycosyltransferase [Solicola sp. PLA-1-18]|uniref:glycosyltransferase n=1 Tax=Solicola sp. PLA-1-18 TaxID=3380532 RepID=UPI003B75DED1